MKRLSLLVLFFYCCSFACAPRARAVAPLALLAPAAIGAAVVAIAGTQYALKGDHSGTSYQSDGRNLTVPLVAYKKLAVQGGEILLGKSVTAVLDAKKAFDDNVLDGYTALSGLVDNLFGADNPSEFPGIGDVCASDPANAPSCPSGPRINSIGSTVYSAKQQGWCTGTGYCNFGGLCRVPNGNWYILIANTMVNTPPVPGFLYKSAYVSITADDPTFPPAGVPDILPPDQVGPLAQKFADAAPIRPDVKEDLDNLLKDHPEYWPFANTPTALPEPNNDISDYPPAQPITAPDVNQWAQGQSAGAQQNYIDTLQSLVDANPTDTGLASELAKAQAEQAQQQAEDVEEAADTYDPISSNPFDEAYNPGAFDIPARFTSFLNNVKSTGLFSFSSSFFNSLPGGGSPVYTIDAGTYGTHTIDLSETMGTGLAVLKTVLLLLFGFLSIRVVILKR